MEVILSFILASLVSSAVTWQILRSKLQAATEKVRTELVTERASTYERLKAAETQIQELKISIENKDNTIKRYIEETKVAAATRATAEAKLSQIADVEASLKHKELQITQLNTEKAELQSKLSQTETQLDEERKASQEKLALLEQAQDKLTNVFKALSADALRSNNQSFLQMAQSTFEKIQERAQGDLTVKQQAIDELVKPLRNSLKQVDEKLQQLEVARTDAYATLKQQIKSLATTQSQLHNETANLTKALRSPTVRGRWGEIQLKRVVEIAGMVEHCDFVQQASVNTETGRLRPDMVVKLPNQKNIIVDSKAPLLGYLDALEAQDESIRIEKMKAHARHIRTHLSQLGDKGYWEQFQSTPEFVVLFLPGESFFSAALEHDPHLIEFGVDKSVILATPTTLIALLKAVAYGWRQEKLSQNAQQISELGKQMYERTQTLSKHFEAMRKGLDTTVQAFNKTVGALESRVLVTARKFKEVGAHTGEDIDYLEPIEKSPRKLKDVGTENDTTDEIENDAIDS